MTNFPIGSVLLVKNRKLVDYYALNNGNYKLKVIFVLVQ